MNKHESNDNENESKMYVKSRRYCSTIDQQKSLARQQPRGHKFLCMLIPEKKKLLHAETEKVRDFFFVDIFVLNIVVAVKSI